MKEMKFHNGLLFKSVFVCLFDLLPFHDKKQQSCQDGHISQASMTS